MIYDKRNRDNLSKLADNTKVAALKWYEYCVSNKIEILIYETIRSLTTQKQYVAKGASQTLKSYHIVGQALDFVPVDSKGNTLWSGYSASNIQKAVKYAKQLGFEWGGDWKSFVDKPHLQFNYKGYGTDTFGKLKVNGDELIVSQYNTLLAKIEQLEKQVEGKLTKVAPREASLSHKEAWEWLIKQGLSNGTNPQGYLTREQFSTILRNFYEKFVC